MYIFIIILTIIICILLGLIVLIQNPKGGGLDSTFGGTGNQIFGAKRSADVVEKTTWYLAIALMAMSVFSALAVDRSEPVDQNNITTTDVQNKIITGDIPTEVAPPPAGAPEGPTAPNP